MPYRRPVLIGLYVLLIGSAVHAQQTIINVPSDALTPVGQHFVLHESQFLPESANATYNTTNFYTYGLSENTELAMTQYNVDNGGSEFAALGVGFKSVFEVLQQAAPELETKLTMGFMLPVTLQDETPAPALGYFPYSHVSFLVPGTQLRLLGGCAAGSENLFGVNTVSALAGVEYPLTEHWSFTGEWFSGNHNLSALIPGLTYHSKRLIFVGGYKIPNDFDMRESALVLELGWFFGGDSATPAQHYGIRP